MSGVRDEARLTLAGLGERPQHRVETLCQARQFVAAGYGGDLRQIVGPSDSFGGSSQPGNGS